MQSVITRFRKPDITFFPCGRIDITAKVAKALDLQDGDSIDVATDNGDFFLYVRRRFDPECDFRFNATVHSTKGRSYNFRAYSVELCQGIMKFAYIAGDKFSPQVGVPFNHPTCGVAVPLIFKKSNNFYKTMAK